MSAGAIIGGAVLGGIGSLLSSGEPDREWYLPPIDEMGAFEQRGRDIYSDQLTGIEGLFGDGGAFEKSFGAQRNLAQMYGDAAKTGFTPTEADISSSYSLAGRLQEPERVAMQQRFVDQNTDAARQGALMGRGTTDPILRAKLMQSQAREQERFGAQQTSRGTQIAMGRPEERLRLEGARSNILGGLASQALQNKMTLLGLGQQISSSERAGRFQKANMQRMRESKSTAQRIGGALSGMVAGAGIGADMAGALGSFGGSGSGGSFSSGIGQQMSTFKATSPSYAEFGSSYSAPSPAGLGVNTSLGASPFGSQMSIPGASTIQLGR